MGELRNQHKGGTFVDNLGADITRQREAKNMTIEELSQKTKISVAVLKDIENGKFDRYKGDEAYVKMYLKKISNVLSMDADTMTQQYIELTREIKMEELREKQEEENHNEDIVKKGKKFSFDAPQLTRKPSVYEDKSHVTIIRAAIILVLLCLVIVVIWYGFYSTRSQSKDPNFVPQTQTSVEGNIPTDEPNSTNPTDNNQNTPASSNVEITRNDRLDFTFKLPEGSEKFTFKIEFGNKSWAQLFVNGKAYDQFESKIYQPSEDGKPETVELEFTVADFENLRLKNGYSAGHHYYINNQEIPLTDEDVSYSVSTLKLALAKE